RRRLGATAHRRRRTRRRPGAARFPPPRLGDFPASRRARSVTRRQNVRTTADAVIIGAGIMGCAVAYALAERGLTNVVVLEKDPIGRGATSDAAGGIRQQFSTETNVRLATYSVRVWESFHERFGQDIGLRQQGYLFLLTDPAEEPVFRQN